MTLYPLIPLKEYPLMAHTKTKIHPKTTVSDVINVYKSNNTSQPI